MKLPDHARKVYQGGIFSIHEWEQEMFDGSSEIFERVSALPIVKLICVMEDGSILINKEEQPGKDIFLSLPGGRLELGETLEEGARRELLEETGYQAESYELIDTHHVGYRLDLDIHLYVVRWLTQVTLPSLDPGERIESRTVSLDEFLELSLTQALHPKSLQYFLLREYYWDPTLTHFKNIILGNR